MTEYSRMVKGSYTVTTGTLGTTAPSAKIVNLPFKPDFVEVRNLTQWATPAQHGIPYAWWDASTSVTVTAVQYDTFVNVFNATPVLTTDSVIVGGGISVFSAGQMLQFGATKQVVASTKGTTTSFQVTAHGYSVGDVVMFEGLYQSSTTGMPQMNGLPFTVITVTDANNFVVAWNSNNATYYTNLSGSPASAKVKKILYPYIYFPGTSFIRAITLGTTTTIDTTDAHNFVVGQQVAFRIPQAWGTVELNSLPNTLTPGAPAYGYVVAVTDYDTVVVNIDSSAYTAFNVNQTVASVSGLSYPQIVAVGDVNTGGVQISAGSQLYPPPYYSVTGTARTNTIGGPGIQGAFVNNTSQGFVIGNSASRADTSSWVGGSTNDIIEWRAYLHDMTVT